MCSKSSQLHKLNAFRVNGLLPIDRHLRNAPLAEEAKYPILLPKSHHLTNLIVRHYHETSGHAGVEHVLSLTRERFWPNNGRATVKEVVNTLLLEFKRCQICLPIEYSPTDPCSPTWAWIVLAHLLLKEAERT